MSHTPLFDQLARALRVATLCTQHRISTQEGLERVMAAEAARQQSRRAFLAGAGRFALASALVPGVDTAFARPARPQTGGSTRVGILGAGLAGLACADTLTKAGISFTVYEGNNRVGGRNFSLSQAQPRQGDAFFFPGGQVAERGGEFIDNLHKTMLGYAQRFGLTKTDFFDNPGVETFYVNGKHYTEAEVVDALRDFVPAIHAAARLSSGAPTANVHTDASDGIWNDVRLDNTSLLAFLDGDNPLALTADPVVREVLRVAYVGEYGLEADLQSCLNFVLFFHIDKRSKLALFGNQSNERWHLAEGNGEVAQRLAAALPGGVGQAGNGVLLTKQVTRLSKPTPGPTGAVKVEFADGTAATHEVVVITIPFPVLRKITLDASLGLPAWKIRAITQFSYGTNAKTMIGMGGNGVPARPWSAQGRQGTGYIADRARPNAQVTFETSWETASDQQAIFTDYAGGERGARLDQLSAEEGAKRFLEDLDRGQPPVYAGIAAAARRTGTSAMSQLVVHREHWPSNPFTLGAYSCYRPGDFTTIANNEGKPVDNLYFAGEHANSFYVWQGFMEGACLSGIDAARAVIRALR